MSYLPDRATVSRRADQEVAGRTRFVATGAQTRGDFGLFKVTLPAGGGGPGPHLHRTFSESFHVLEGRLAVLDGDTWTTAGPGDLVHVPGCTASGPRTTTPAAGS